MTGGKLVRGYDITFWIVNNCHLGWKNTRSWPNTLHFLWIDSFYVLQKCWLTDLEALKLWKVPSGKALTAKLVGLSSGLRRYVTWHRAHVFYHLICQKNLLTCWMQCNAAHNVFKANSITRSVLSFTILEPRHQVIGDLYVVQERRATDFEAPNL